jgi:uncharacterized membrane protein YphA (DoxX/SURF4 family)
VYFKENIHLKSKIVIKVFIPILRILFGLLFIGSAVLKLFPIDAFEMILIKQVGVSWGLAPLLARLLILFEFALGVCIGFGFWTKKMVYASLAMLAVFTGYLLLLIATGEGDENCGCFGELIPMDGPTSVGKNLIMMALGLVLIWKNDLVNRFSFKWAGPVLAIISIPVLFLLLPLPEGDFDQEATLDSTLISKINHTQNWDLETDDRLIIVMYSECIHCKQLATLLSTISTEQADNKLRILLFGKEDSIKEFVEQTGIEHLPYRRTTEHQLMQGINGTFPSAIFVENGSVVSNWSGRGVNMDLLSKILLD